MSKITGNIVFIYFCVTFAVAVYIVKDECPPNEVYLICGSACPFNCSDPGPVTCSDDCVEGCFCKSGFLRNDTGVCVNADECIGETNPICSNNEEFLSCGTACARTCTDPDPVDCGLACSMGCFCKAGYVRDQKTKQCVTLDKCPVDPDPVDCGLACSMGCFCKAGYVRDQKTKQCITLDKCPVDPDLVNCGLACSIGCFGKAGHVRDQKTKQCVMLDKCPVEPCLNKNEVYDQCLAGCEPSCDNPTPICAKICAGGCVCAPGLLRGGDGECVSVDKCNSTDTGNAALSEYMNVINTIIGLSKV